MFRAVQRRVRATTNQEPYLGFNALGDVYLGGPVLRFARPTAPEESAATQMWALVKDSTDISSLEVFRKQYGLSNPFFDRLAVARIDELKRRQVVARASLPADPSLPIQRCDSGVRIRAPDGWIYCFVQGATWEQLQAYMGSIYTPIYGPTPYPADPTVIPARPTSAYCEGFEIGNGRQCLRPKDTFKDCPDCPEMVAVSAGEFMMGVPKLEVPDPTPAPGEPYREVVDEDGVTHRFSVYLIDEMINLYVKQLRSLRLHPPEPPPHHKVTIAKPFAVGKFEVTFAEWDACVAGGGCKHKPDDSPLNNYRIPAHLKQELQKLADDSLVWGRGRRPVMNVSWDDVTKDYLPWLSRKTSKTYRLVSEAEWEYAARAGSRARYAWGDEIGRNRANCAKCGSQWDRKKTAPVGSFPANAFGLHDMHGNVWEWVADCWNESYQGAPSDGSAWITGDCSRHVVRGGSWIIDPQFISSGTRLGRLTTDRMGFDAGFRLARTLHP
jgi:formylglycine-generating enzyme required for sulfatase activity